MFDGTQGVAERIQALELLQQDYTQFRDFYWDCSVELLGFEPSVVQLDIADYLQYGPMNSMIQAQRGEAKTTITGCYVIWCQIHDPSTICMILSAGGDMATQIATWCIKILHGMDNLECLRVDKSYPGARSSTQAYDIHHDLKGADKSPSICCMGINKNNQGYRAHLLVSDDIESKVNSDTEGKREKLLSQSKELSSFVQAGRIVYLGTPQSSDSIYNTLYSRGFDMRVWPGRVPTAQEMPNYMIGGHCILAPIVQKMIADGAQRTGFGILGTRGEPVDPVMQDEEKLIFQETDKGPADFDLQYMLNTKLSDADRFPLKLCNLMFYGLSPDKVPGQFIWGNSPDKIHPVPGGAHFKDNIYMPMSVSGEYFEYSGKYISLDPSGGGANADETGYAILYIAHGYIFVMEVGGFRGGFEESEMVKILQKIQEWGVSTAIIEKNYGNGALGSALNAMQQKHGVQFDMVDVWASGQKEKRIIDSIGPIMGTHKMVVNSSCIDYDLETVKQYPNELRASYSWLYQLSRLTRDRGSLVHEDRLDALAQGCKYLHELIRVDAQREEARKVQQASLAFITDPTGLFKKANIRKYTTGGEVIKNSSHGGSVFNRFKSRR